MSGRERGACCCLAAGRSGLLAHMKGRSAGLQACAAPVLMFNACLGPEHAYYRLVGATVAFQRLCCADSAVYSVRLNASGITITDRGGWCGWHDVCRSNVWRAGPLDSLRGFAGPLLMFRAAVVCLRGRVHESGCSCCCVCGWGSLWEGTNIVLHSLLVT